jgi:hypothetical protein
MNSRPVSATLALVIAMPALACDEEYVSSTPQMPVAWAVAPRAHTVSPGAFSFFGAGASGMQDGTSSTVTIVDDQNGKRIEIRIVDDEIEVKVDGEVVPDDRIGRDEGGLTIFGDNGEVLYTTSLRFAHADRSLHGFAFEPRWGASAQAYGEWLADQEILAAELPKVMLGVHMNETGPALEKQLRLEPGKTTLLTGVYEGLPARTAGVEEFDVVISVKGSESADPSSIRKLLQSKEPGDVLELEVLRAGDRQNVSVTLEKYDTKRMNAATLRGAPSGVSTYFDRDPAMYERFVMQNPIGQGGIGIVFDPSHMQLLREAPLAAAESLRRHALDHMRSLEINEESLHEQIDALSSRLDELTEMMHKMIEEAAAAKEKALKHNET